MQRIGKYEIVEKLGQGGMGAVYRGRDAIIGRDVAIKVIQERALNAPAIKKRFYREARSAGQLSHENITIIYDVGEEDGMPFLVMEYLEGRDLQEMLNRQTPLPTDAKLRIAAQICHGLHYAHQQGIVHRDIKPANIRVLPNGRVKIMDFGIARIQNETQALTMTNASLGTPRYMAPEQIKGEPIDHRADIFSFGVLLYELLTGNNPFMGDHVTTIIYKILNNDPKPLNIVPGSLSHELQPIVSKCLAKDRDERYQNFAAVLQDLQPVLSQEDETALLPTPPAAVPPVPPPDAPGDRDETQAITEAPEGRPDDTRAEVDQTLLRPPPPRSPSRPGRPRAEAPPAPPRKKAASTPRKASSKKGLWAVVGVVALLGIAVVGSLVIGPSGEVTESGSELSAPEAAAPENDRTRLPLPADSLADGAALPDPVAGEEGGDIEDPATTGDPVSSGDPARASAEQLRTRMDQARRTLVGRGTETVIATVFRQAEAARQTGLRQFEAGDYDEATRSFRSARDLFARAKQTLDQQDRPVTEPPPSPSDDAPDPAPSDEPADPEIVDLEVSGGGATAAQTNADRARAAMETARNGVPASLRRMPTYQEALSVENRGIQAYGARLYDQALARFNEAQTLFEEAATAPASEGTPSEALQAALTDMARILKNSIEQEDVGGMQAMMYRGWEALFDNAKDISAVVHTGTPQVSGTRATVPVRIELEYTDNTNRRKQNTTSSLWTLDFRDDAWMLTRVTSGQ